MGVNSVSILSSSKSVIISSKSVIIIINIIITLTLQVTVVKGGVKDEEAIKELVAGEHLYQMAIMILIMMAMTMKKIMMT